MTSSGWRTTPVSQMTDENGRVVIDHWYPDAFFAAKARYKLENPEVDMRFQGTSHYPKAIQAYTDDGFRQGVAVVPLPESDDDSGLISISIDVFPPGNVLARVVSTEGEGIADLGVEAKILKSFAFGSGQTWKTQTNKNGWFKMCGIPIGSKPIWKLDPNQVKTLAGSGRTGMTSVIEERRYLKLH